MLWVFAIILFIVKCKNIIKFIYLLHGEFVISKRLWAPALLLNTPKQRFIFSQSLGIDITTILLLAFIVPAIG